MTRPVLLFLHRDAARVDYRVALHHWLAAEVGFRSLGADLPLVRVEDGRITAPRFFEVATDGRARLLGGGAVEPSVILHREPAWDDAEQMAALVRASPRTLVSFHPDWRQMCTKWTVECCLQAGDRVGRRVPRPRTYLLEKAEIGEQLREVGAERPLIFKPSSSAQCAGILVSTPETFATVAAEVARSSWERYVVQELVEPPLLYDGKRFDLRLYALVRSFRPLEFRLYREGLVRVAAQRYDPAAPAAGPGLLTGVSYRQQLGVAIEDLAVSELLADLARRGYRIDTFWQRLEQLLADLFTCLARYPRELPAGERGRRFYLAGLDVMMTDEAGDYGFSFLETNHVPQLRSWGSRLDDLVRPVHRQWLADVHAMSRGA